MSQQSPSTRTEGGAHSQFARSCRRANELKVSQVCAGDQQHKTGESKCEPHDSSADTVRHRSLQRFEPQAVAFVCGVLLADIIRQSNHALLCLPDCDAGLQPAE
jgi:hypothetical protein